MHTNICHGNTRKYTEKYSVHFRVIPWLLIQAKAYWTQLEKGDKYTELNPAIGLTFTDFVMFSQQQLKSQVITDFIF